MFLCYFATSATAHQPLVLSWSTAASPGPCPFRGLTGAGARTRRGGAGRGSVLPQLSPRQPGKYRARRAEPRSPEPSGREEGRGGARGGGRGAGRGRRRDPLLLPLGPPRGPRSPGQQRRRRLRRRSSHPGPGGPQQRSPHRSQEGGVSICSRVDVVGTSAEDPRESY